MHPTTSGGLSIGQAGRGHRNANKTEEFIFSSEFINSQYPEKFGKFAVPCLQNNSLSGRYKIQIRRRYAAMTHFKTRSKKIKSIFSWEIRCGCPASYGAARNNELKFAIDHNC
jgi:hypothetical protein